MTAPLPASPKPSADETAALRFLDSRVDYERAQAIWYPADVHKLDRMRELVRRLGDPQQRLAVVHVAGTKGKGSTSAMIAAVLRQAGYRTGLFTSPHLDRVEERIAIDGRLCPPGELAALLDQVRPHVEAMDREADAAEGGPTYFEIITAVALLHFVAHRVEVAVLEVGMGGRLDSTNICRPNVAVITSISFDHMRQLGHTLDAIAREKAGIIKPHIPVISGVTDPVPREVIRQTCLERDAPLEELETDFHFSYQPPHHLEQSRVFGRVSVEGRNAAGPYAYDDLELPLPGRHQGANAAVAVAALEALRRQGWSVAPPQLRAGLAGVRWPARIELVRRNPAVIIDAAHNVASIEALVATLDECFQVRRRRLLFATTRDKDLPGMLRQLLPRFDDVILTRYTKSPRAVPPEELAALARELSGRDYPVEPDAAVAWETLSRRTEPEDLICATGSFFLAAEIRRLATGGADPA